MPTYTVIPITEPLTRVQQYNVRDWIKALRSGDYTQSHYWMKATIDKKVYHCAIGVAFETEYVPSKQLTNEEAWIFLTKETLSEWFPKHFGFKLQTPLLHFDNKIQYNIVNINDQLEIPFPQIAEILDCAVLRRVAYEAKL